MIIFKIFFLEDCAMQYINLQTVMMRKTETKPLFKTFNKLTIVSILSTFKKINK